MSFSVEGDKACSRPHKNTHQTLTLLTYTHSPFCYSLSSSPRRRREGEPVRVWLGAQVGGRDGRPLVRGHPACRLLPPGLHVPLLNIRSLQAQALRHDGPLGQPEHRPVLAPRMRESPPTVVAALVCVCACSRRRHRPHSLTPFPSPFPSSYSPFPTRRRRSSTASSSRSPSTSSTCSCTRTTSASTRTRRS
jgi:hypothetical protein